MDSMPPVPVEEKEVERNPSRPMRMEFTGETVDLIVLLLKNAILTILTLGIYFPFAKTNIRQFFWAHTEIDGHALEYTGQGMELLKGYIFAALYFGVFAGLQALLANVAPAFAGILTLVYFLVTVCIVPYAVFGSHCYKMTRTKLRGIPFQVKKEGRWRFIKTFIKMALITLFTFGLATPWFLMAINREKWANTYYGPYHFKYTGEGTDFFILKILEGLLTGISAGLLFPYAHAKVLRYHAENMSLGDLPFKLNLSGWDLFVLYFKNILIVIFTLGLGLPWLIILNARFLITKLEVQGQLDFDQVRRNFEEQDDHALADSMADMLDVDFGF